MRLIAANGELLPTGQADVDARKVLDVLRTASTISGSFHAVNSIGLVLDDEAIRSRWHAQAAQHLADLQAAGLEWITGVWPDATKVPQAFVHVATRADAFAPYVDGALEKGDTPTAARLLGELAGDFGKAAQAVAGYRAVLELHFGGALIPIGALTIGPASILKVLADDAVKIEQLMADINAARSRIEERARDLAAAFGAHLATLEVGLFALGHAQADKPVKEWGKAFIVMIAAGTTPNLQKEAFLQDINEIVAKGIQIGRLGRDVFALVNLGSAIKSIGDAAGGLALRPVEALLTAARDRVRAAAARLHAATAETIATTRTEIRAEIEYTHRLAELCRHLQEQVVAAQAPPTLVVVD